ncbi:dynactin subunit 6 [Frieseomelitta varia]|uniref:dynactin subunit 6 n=1 Tax=Frieseomelitta varia TaxID=561572 RepID=UPI001CB69E1D|nr:dynactin subunit 6 [Frieseomelitta varia]XP_043515916.1 dynactin subunit 6 [Frieseomelitta varia]
MNSFVNRRTNVKIAVGALVCEESILKGDITIGPNTIIHPKASIIAEAGPIIIGEGNIIEEMATIANRLPVDAPEPTTIPVQIIGSYNVFETDCTCEAFKVGDCNILESKAYVGREVELTNGCIIGASCSLTESDTIPEDTIIYGNECQRREMHGKPYPPISQIEFLLKILPTYHHIRKPNIVPTKNEGGL